MHGWGLGGQECLSAVPRVGEHEGADYAREVQRTGARELGHLVVGIVVGPSYMCARLVSA